jgi:hypothetical protein
MQRCLVKAIALHGLGLYIYAGEDLPAGEEPAEEPKRPNTAKQVAVDAFLAMSPDEQKFIEGEAVKIIAEHERDGSPADFWESRKLDNEESMALWSLLPAPVRTAIKAAKKEAA